MLVNFVLIPQMELLDIAGPYEIFSRTPGVQVQLVSATGEAVTTVNGMTLMADCSRTQARPADLLVVAGGAAIDTAVLDAEWIDFIRTQAETAHWVLGICTGSLLLGAAGLLEGKKAGCHWMARELLRHFGAIPTAERIVVDGKFYTSGGVTSGIDAALRIVADVQGQITAQAVQLIVEYDPEPPFPGGTPETSPAEVVATVLGSAQESMQSREQQMKLAAQRLYQSE